MKLDPTLWAHLLPLLDELLDRPAAQRDAWVRALPVDEPTKAALLQLLEERLQLEAEDFLQALPALADAGGEGPARDRSWQAGQQIGAYRLLREIGRGGMSTVWLAERDDGQLRRRVALKVPHAGPDREALAERLRRERDILAALQHRHIARLYDVGSTPDGVPFLVLEYIEGRTLLEHCSAQRLTLEQRLRLFIQVLRAVQHAHGLLVLHRDIKPSNILVDAAGDVKLLDFGIAKLLARDGDPVTALTQQGARLLTPDYAAPEQITGEPIGTATDVYALGVLLFELLTAQRPYRLQRRSAAALEEAILAAEPRRPSDAWQDDAKQAADFAAGPRRLRRALRGDLDLIVLTALQKRPERRYATAEAFEQDIRRYLGREPVLARPDSRWYRLRKFVARNTLQVGAAAAIAMALGLGLGVALWQAREARLEAAKATAVKDFMLGLFESGSVEQADSLRKRQQSVQALLEDGAKSLQTGLAGQPLIRDEMQSVVGRLLHELGVYGPAIELRRRRVELQASIGAALPARVTAGHELADSLALQGDDAGAEQALGNALKPCPPAGSSAPAACHALRVAIGLRALGENRLDAAAGAIEPSMRALMHLAPGSAEAADGLAALGVLRARQNRADEAQQLFQQASAVRVALWGVDSTRLARSRYQIAMSLWEGRRLAMAEAELAGAREHLAKSLGPEHPTTALVELQLGRLRQWQRGAGQREIDHAHAVIAAHAAQLDPDKVFEARLVRLEQLLADGRLAQAGDLLRQIGPETPSSVALADEAQASRIWYLQVTGRFDEVRTILRGLRSRYVAELGETHPDVADLDFQLANLDLSEDRFEDARAGFERVLRTQPAREEVFGSPRHQALTGLARVAMDQGQFEQAWPVISANFDRAQRTPREEQYADGLNQVSLRMGQALTGIGRAAEARPHFERTIAALEQRYANNPTLAVTRAHFANCLVRLGDIAAARAQLALARAALEAEPLVGPQYRATVARVEASVPALPGPRARAGR